MEELLESKSKAIAKNIEKWKESLLDLSKRNQLVNFRYNKKRVLKINNDIYQLYEKLIEDEKIKNIEKLDLDYDLNDPIQLKEFQAITKKLRKERNTVINEKGINILYLTFGMLAWKEHDNAEDKVHAPLLLLPVELYQANRNTPMQLRLFEDQLVVNPSLQFKFKNEFGILLPDFEEVDSLAEYIEYTKTLIQNLADCEVIENIFLALLQFSKIALYKDMEQYKDLIETHPIVGSIASTQKTYDDEILGEIEGINPEESTKESFQVLDADSSQIEAIIAAKKGYSYVLQGPPGTGKSQTISNIIAECLAKGQKVLFVSEKIAALNVVSKRLSQVGLGEFCLELHSNKSNKKSVITNLYDTYISNNRKPKHDETLLNNIEQIKEKMNSYVKALHTVHEKYKENAYTMHGQIATLSDVPTIAFPLPEQMTDTQRIEIISILDQLSNEEDEIATFKQSLWNDIQETIWSLAKETQLKENLTQYLKVLQTGNRIAEQWFEEHKVTVNSFNQLLGMLYLHEEFGEDKEFLIDEWLVKQNFEEQLQFIQTYYDDFKRSEKTENQLLESYSVLDFPNIKQTIKKEGYIEEKLLLPSFFGIFINEKSQEIIQTISDIQGLIVRNEIENHLSPIFEETVIDSYKKFKEVQPLFELLKMGAKIPSHWIEDETSFEDITLNIHNDQSIAEQFKLVQEPIISKVYVDKIDPNVLSSANTLKNINPSLKETYSYCYDQRKVIIEYMNKSICEHRC